MASFSFFEQIPGKTRLDTTGLCDDINNICQLNGPEHETVRQTKQNLRG